MRVVAPLPIPAQPAEPRLWPPGTLRVPAGTCPGCAGPGHAGVTCDGRTFAEILPILLRLPGAIYVPDDRRW